MSFEPGKLQQNPFGDWYFPSINHQSFLKSPASSVFSDFYKDMLSQAEGLFIIIGSDSGLLYQYLKSRENHPQRQFILIDFRTVIEKAGLVETDQEIWEGNVRLVDENFDFSRLEGAFDNFILKDQVQLLSSMAVVDNPVDSPYWILRKELISQFNSFYKFQLVSQQAVQFEQPRILNAADNVLPLNLHLNRFKKSSAIILAGGPSLDDSIQWVKENEQYLIIFAVGRIAKRLKIEGIVPDFFVSVDPQDVSFDNAKSMFEFTNRSTLIHSFHVNPKLLSQWRGQSLYMGLKYGWYNQDYKQNVPTMGPTVTNTALTAAFSLGCDQIILSGVDLCFYDGKTHESSSDEAKTNKYLRYQNAVREVLTNAGEKAKTDLNLSTSLETLQEQVTFYKSTNPQLTLYSLGKNSAKIKGVDFCEPENLSLFDKKASIMETFWTEIALTQQDRHDYAAKTQSELESRITHLETVKKLADQALEVVPKMYSKETGELKSKTLSRVERLRKKVNRKIDPDGDYFFSYNAQNFSETFVHVENEAEMAASEVQTQMSGFFTGVKKTAKQMIQLLELGVERAQMRVDETAPDSNVADLYPLWKAWQEYGRALQWREWHQDRSFSSDESSVLAECETRFESILRASKTGMTKKLTKTMDDPERLNAQLKRLFQEGKPGEIKNIQDYAKDKPNLVGISALTSGLLEELEGHVDAAENWYQTIESGHFHHLAMKRRLALAMDRMDQEAALPLLEQLCQYSLDYMISYADLLDVMGQKENSVRVLVMYAQQHPDNIGVLLKVAQRQAELGLQDLAKETLQLVQEKEPNNQGAQVLLAQMEKTPLA